ncbi:hypothetical protein M3Y98_00511100 [Aphelenchoides besseyi]|nr:hypothetical protein M3Y98_00511100 [Aphelenchoides besseyi]
MSKIHDFYHDEVSPPLISAQNLLTPDYTVKSVGLRIAKSNHNYEFEPEFTFFRITVHNHLKVTRLTSTNNFFLKTPTRSITRLSNELVTNRTSFPAFSNDWTMDICSICNWLIVTI